MGYNHIHEYSKYGISGCRTVSSLATSMSADLVEYGTIHKDSKYGISGGWSGSSLATSMLPKDTHMVLLI